MATALVTNLLFSGPPAAAAAEPLYSYTMCCEVFQCYALYCSHKRTHLQKGVLFRNSSQSWSSPMFLQWSANDHTLLWHSAVLARFDQLESNVDGVGFSAFSSCLGALIDLAGKPAPWPGTDTYTTWDVAHDALDAPFILTVSTFLADMTALPQNQKALLITWGSSIYTTAWVYLS